MREQNEVLEVADIVVNRVVEQLGDPKLNASKLIKSLVDLTVHDVNEPDIGLEKAKYHSTRLALELGNAKNDSDKDRRYINRIWKDMLEAYEVIEPSIGNDIRKAGYHKILKPRKTDPKTGRVEFYLDFEELNDDQFSESVNKPASEDCSIIQYEMVKKPKMSFLGRSFSDSSMKDRDWLIGYIPTAMITVALIWVLYIVEFNKSFLDDDFLFWLFYLSLFIFSFRAYFSIERKGSAIAPSWMKSAHTRGNLVLEKVYTGEKDKKGSPEYRLVLAKYEATCPICGGEVDVGRGRKQFAGRLIGRCINNPIEHIYSFDHVTRKGVPLRNDTYVR